MLVKPLFRSAQYIRCFELL